MKKKLHPVTRSIVVLSSSLVMILVIGLACNTPGGGGATATEAAAGAIHTAAAQTVRAELTLENTAQAPPETVTGVPATDTPIPEGPTNTPTPQASETPTFTPTLAIPINRHNSIKLYLSTGVDSRRGTEYDLAGLAWQYRWGGGLR